MGGDRGKAKLFDVHLGHKICELRRAAKISQTALGKPLGVSFQQIQKYETGRNRISAGQLWLLCQFLDVPIASMFDSVTAKMFKTRGRKG